MNHDIPPFDDTPLDHAPFDNPAHEREWQAQERALQAERLGLDPSSGDARLRRYRALTRVLREPMPDALPADFARQMAVRVGAAPARQPAAESRLEWALTATLIALLAVSAAVVTLLYGNAWLPAFRQLLPPPGAPAMHWLLALGACVGATWLLGLRPAHRPTG
ncbi:MAG: hypothetical protein RSP_03840 [Rhodanobacter sp.]